MSKQKQFSFVAVVRRTVLDNVRLKVRARGPKEAYEKAEKFLSVFPEPSDVDGIDYGYIENRMNVDTETLELDFEKP